MATVDELLNATTESQVCTIDPDTRVITVPSCYTEFGVEADEKVNRINFQCPKVVGDNIDLTAFNLYINYMNASGQYNAYLVDDVTVSGDNITFSWLLSRHVTEKSGTVNYIVCAKKSDDTGVVNEWNTKVATGTVGVGLEATTEVEEQNADVIEQILARITDVESTQPDWDQNDSTQQDYIKNRPCFTYEEYNYTSEVVDLISLSEGITKIATFNSRLSDSVTAWGYSKTQTSPIKDLAGCYYECIWYSKYKDGRVTITHLYPEKNLSMMPLVPIDENNYYFTYILLGDLKIYVICDLTSLSAENKTKFSSVGFYLETPSGYTPRNSAEKFPVQTIEIKEYCTSRLAKKYLPTGIQPQEISDPNNYFTTKTVEGALDQIGSQLNSYVKKTEIPVDGTTIKLNDEGQLTLALSNASEVSF